MQTRLLILVLLNLLFQMSVAGQVCIDLNGQKNLNGYTIHSVKVHYGFGAPRAVKYPVEAGDPFDPDDVVEAARWVDADLKNYRLDQMHRSEQLSLTFISTCVSIREGQQSQVDVAFTPVVVSAPRSAGMVSFHSRPTASPLPNPEALPWIVKHTNPNADADYNPATGLSLGGRINVPLYLYSAGPSPGVRLAAEFRKSLTQPYYNARLDTRARLGSGIGAERGIILGLRLDASRRPFYTTVQFEAIELHLGPSFEHRISGLFPAWFAMGAGVRYSSYRIIKPGFPWQRETGGEFRFVMDSFAGGGFTRLGSWADVGNADLSGNPNLRPRFGRYATAAHHSRLLPYGLGKTVDLEVTGGVGKSFGTVPGFRDFVGGYQYDFPLFESRESVAVSSVPYGPLLRSYGERQAGPPADSYFHANLTVGIPFLAWAHPLCHGARQCAGEQEVGAVLTSTERLLTADYILNGVDSDKARKLVLREATELRQSVRYMLGRASEYSIRTVFMYDAARLVFDRNGRHGSTNVHAFGFGLRITLPFGFRSEVGYMFDVADRNRGSFILRTRLGHQ